MDKQFDFLQLIERLSNAPGASGFEDEVAAVGREYGQALAGLKEDSLRNLYFYRNSNQGGRPVVLIDGHSDEVSFMVHAIQPNGTIRFVPLGGWVASNIPAHRVRVRNALGEYIPGIVAAKPIHFMTQEEKNAAPDVSEMVIDVGASSRQEAIEDFHIRIGEPIVPDVSFEYLPEKDLMLGKAFDCRLGCACVVETLRLLDGEKLNVDIVGSFSAQEEIGTRGIQVVANTVKPDIAIIFEGCPADDTFSPDYLIQSAIRKGPMLRHFDRSMVTNPRFQRYALDMAAREGIPVQESVRTGGRTNGGPVHLSGEGIPTIVIGLPVRYTHSHYGFAALADCRRGADLAAAVLRSLTEDVIRGF